MAIMVWQVVVRDGQVGGEVYLKIATAGLQGQEGESAILHSETHGYYTYFSRHPKD